MNLTRFSDYALRVLIYSALHPDRLLTIAEIAASYGISENHLMKVVHRLAQLSVLSTVRGKGGGLRLAKTPEAINLGAVLRQIEQGPPLVECMQERTPPCQIAPACQLQRALQLAEQAFYRVLDDYTLADIVQNRQDLLQLLQPST